MGRPKLVGLALVAMSASRTSEEAVWTNALLAVASARLGLCIPNESLTRLQILIADSSFPAAGA